MRSFLKNPRTSLIIGTILLFCGIIEAFEAIAIEFVGFNIGLHHGVLLFALSQVFVAIIDIFEGLEDIEIAQLAKEMNAMEEYPSRTLSKESYFRMNKEVSTYKAKHEALPVKIHNISINKIMKTKKEEEKHAQR